MQQSMYPVKWSSCTLPLDGLVSEPTHLDGSLLLVDDMFVLKWFCWKKIINSVIRIHHFSDHDAVKRHIRSKLQNSTHDNIEFSIAYARYHFKLCSAASIFRRKLVNRPVSVFN